MIGVGICYLVVLYVLTFSVAKFHFGTLTLIFGFEYYI